MATNIKVLDTKTLTSTSPTTVYGPGGTKSALVSGLTFLNNQATPLDVMISTGASGSPILHKVSLAGSPGVSANISDTLTLAGANADQIKAWLSVGGGNVTCFVFGIERD